MPHGICNLSSIPVRALADDTSEMHTQLLYGDTFTILEKRKEWSRLRIAFDGCEGWISNRQYLPISEQAFESTTANDPSCFSSDLISFSTNEQALLIPVLLGSSVAQASLMGHHFEGETTHGRTTKSAMVETALLYLHAPYLWGGKTPFGIDSPGLTQMVYRIHGHKLLRLAADQATQGEALSFIEESEAGDLAFFDNKDGVIDHVGLIMNDNYIIHAYGKVRIDRLDHTGIFNTETGRYSHPLRVIKKIV